ncbi:hypothetical protein ACFQ3S_00820 [Mucilaginibacter terrae]|uniref:hypothetical protein n=1 Tax=Mucilaginibacter terrae TaxID=1955052 RepID=UPI0036457055
MTAVEIKAEIQKVLNDVPDSALNGILNYVKHLQVQFEDDVRADKNIQKILKEDAELLRRLAQ